MSATDISKSMALGMPAALASHIDTTYGDALNAETIAGDKTFSGVADFTGGLEISGTAVTSSAAELNIMDGVLATAAEINRACDVSTRIVNLAESTAITEADHDGKTVVMGGAGSARTFTLPAATGSGGKYRFVVGAVNTSSYLIKSVSGSDVMLGSVIMVCDGGDSVEGFESAGTNDTITLNGTTTGGAAVGDWIELQDIATDKWAVHGWLTGTGDEVTPFSDTVA